MINHYLSNSNSITIINLKTLILCCLVSRICNKYAEHASAVEIKSVKTNNGMLLKEKKTAQFIKNLITVMVLFEINIF